MYSTNSRTWGKRNADWAMRSAVPNLHNYDFQSRRGKIQRQNRDRLLVDQSAKVSAQYDLPSGVLSVTIMAYLLGLELWLNEWNRYIYIWVFLRVCNDVLLVKKRRYLVRFSNALTQWRRSFIVLRFSLRKSSYVFLLRKWLWHEDRCAACLQITQSA